ncbi:MAG: Lacal_2735 family protein [Chitinophagaceae bacterium]|nr:MAG: Lacal_2735 family protein [Chitinophagaceae bacterium]
MFGLFKKDPLKKLEKDYLELMEKGRDAQRNGDLHAYGDYVGKAEEIMKKIEELKKKGES